MSAEIIDKTDRRILSELDMNARQPLSKIARKVRLSKQSVAYRIERMTGRGIIKGFYTIVDISKLGFIGGRLWIKFQATTIEKEKEIIDHTLKLPNVGWVVTLDGKFDLVVIFWERDIIALKKSIDNFVLHFSPFIKDREISIITREYHLQNKYLTDNIENRKFDEAVSSEMLGLVPLDNTDTKILRILSKNARLPSTKIASIIGTIDKVVTYRIKKLEKNKIIIGHRINIDYSKLGYTWYKVFLSIQNISRQKKESLKNYLRFYKNIIFITEAIGAADIEFEAVLKSNKEFHDLMRDIRLKFSDIIKDYEYVIAYDVHRIRYFPGI